MMTEKPFRRIIKPFRHRIKSNPGRAPILRYERLKNSHDFGGNRTRAAGSVIQCSTTELKSLLPDAVVRVVVVAVVLFYVHGKHLRSCRDGQLTYPHFSWAGLDLLSG